MREVSGERALGGEEGMVGKGEFSQAALARPNDNKYLIVCSKTFGLLQAIPTELKRGQDRDSECLLNIPSSRTRRGNWTIVYLICE